MAGAIPVNMAGLHAFMADPDSSGISTVVGDLAAFNLQAMHVLRGALDPADAAALAVYDGLMDNGRRVLAASKVSEN